MILNSDFVDYYEESEGEEEGGGCCLRCPDAHPGCLCYECKCRQCAHYDGDLKRRSIAVATQDKWEKVGIEIDEVVAETEKAWYVKMDTIRAWVPKSMAEMKTEVRDESHYHSDGTLFHWQNKTRRVQMINLPKWLAVEKKLWDIEESDYWDGSNDFDAQEVREREGLLERE